MFAGIREWSHRHLGMERGDRKKLQSREWAELGRALQGLLAQAKYFVFIL